jgi:predicted AAA+ superfamily ATPase
MIKRTIKTELLECSREYPAVTILGPRQSGKTTLAKQAFPNHAYFSLEDPDTRAQAASDPRGFLALALGGVVLDEIQRCPELLSYLQGMIDADRQPGRFILTGSHQPEVHQAISQSLAGRTAVLELLPFTMAEASNYKDSPRTVFEWMVRGFYPGVYENQLQVSRFYRSYTATYLERDVRNLVQLRDLAPFEICLRLLAGRVGQLVNYASLSNDVGVSATTIKTWISILKACYILIELPPWFANSRKRLVKSPKLYFTDVGLAAWLLGIETPTQAERDPLRGGLYENLLIVEAYKSQLNAGKQPQFYFFRDSNGNEVDLLSTQAGRSFTAIEIKSAATFQPQFIKGIEVFRKCVGENVPVNGKVWYNGDQRTTHKSTAVSNPLLHGVDDL